jgi:cardiolipin synthase
MEILEGIWSVIQYVWPVVIFLFTIFAALVVIFSEKESPGKAIGWVLGIIMLPIVGFIAYLIVGHEWRGSKEYKKRITDRSPGPKGEPRPDPAAESRPPLTRRQEMLLNTVTGSQPLPVSYDNKAQLYFDGEDKFGQLKKDIAAAEHHVHLEYFIWQRDELGDELKDLLFEKVKQGVEVRVITDPTGSLTSSRKYCRELTDQGLQMYFFHPTKGADWRSINHRCHRKAAIIDGKIGYTGGFNVGDEYVNKGPLGFWRDTHVRFEGTAVHDLQSLFLSDWYFATGEDITDPKYFPPSDQPGDLIVQICPSGLDCLRHSMLYTYFNLIVSAERSVRLWTPYFIPEQGLITALEVAALSGVDVKVITPGKYDHPPVQRAARTFMPDLMDIGIEFYEYQDGFTHGKVLSIDESAAVVGTANFDHRGTRMDFEMTSVMIGDDISGQLNAQFEKDLEHCRKVTQKEFDDQSFWTELRGSLSRMVSPMY